MNFWAVLTIFEAVVLLQGWLAWCDDFLTPKQMRRGGIRSGLPFLAHGGMWGDLIFVSPLLAFIITTYGSEWSWIQIAAAVLFSLVVSFAMHETYKKGRFPEAHVQYGKLTKAGVVHFCYMAEAFLVLSLYYILVPYTPWMWVVSALLVLHTIVGTHVVLGLVRPMWYPGRPLQSSGTWGAVGGTAVLTLGCTAWRAFFRG